MKITVNGREETLDDGATVRRLIERLNLSTSACAAEVNKQLVPRREHESHTLRDGDIVELVSLVGGG